MTWLSTLFKTTVARIISASSGRTLLVLAVILVFPAVAHAETSVREILSYVIEPFVAFFALLVYAGGVALNAAAFFSIVQMGALVNGSSGLAVAWGIFRDLGNLVIVFGFITIGIATILDIEKYSAKKMLATLLIVAVLMNFSSLIARGVIDTGNVVALQFYKAINGGTLPTGNVFGDKGISDQFMQAVGLQGIYDPGALYAAYEDRIGQNFFGFALLIIILFTVTAFVFFSIALLFIARFVILAFLITVSPLAFAAMAIPRFRSMTDKWWHLLIDNTLVAPAVLLMLLVSLTVVQDPNLLKMTQGVEWVDTGAASWAYLIVAFGIVCGFFLASLLIAKNLSAFGASWATSLGGKVAFGAAGWVGRQTVGRGFHAASRSFRNTRFAQTELGRLTAGGLDKVASASFDVRGGVAGKGLKGMGIDAGKAGGKDGYRGMEKKAVEARTKYADSFKERSLTRAEAQEREELSVQRSKINNEFNEARDAVDGFENELGKLTEQMRRMEEEKQMDPANWSADKEAKLAVAKTKVAETTDKRDAAWIKADDAKKKLAEFEKTAAAFTKRVKDRTKENVNAYANALDDMTAGYVTAADQLAADKIRTNATKSDTKKALETLEKVMSKKKDKDEGDDDHA